MNCYFFIQTMMTLTIDGATFYFFTDTPESYLEVPWALHLLEPSYLHCERRRYLGLRAAERAPRAARRHVCGRDLRHLGDRAHVDVDPGGGAPVAPLPQGRGGHDV